MGNLGNHGRSLEEADVGQAPMLRPAAAFAAVLSVLDLAIVWGWHTPVLHDVARGGSAGLWLEQGTFALVTFGLWLTAFAGPAIAGALALFMTSMHMTLLGALLGLAPRPVYPAHDHVEHPLGLSAIADQQLGGAVMLAVGGVVYLVAGLWLTSRVLKRPAPR